MTRHTCLWFEYIGKLYKFLINVYLNSVNKIFFTSFCCKNSSTQTAVISFRGSRNSSNKIYSQCINAVLWVLKMGKICSSKQMSNGWYATWFSNDIDKTKLKRNCYKRTPMHKLLTWSSTSSVIKIIFSSKFWFKTALQAGRYISVRIVVRNFFFKSDQRWIFSDDLGRMSSVSSNTKWCC